MTKKDIGVGVLLLGAVTLSFLSGYVLTQKSGSAEKPLSFKALTEKVDNVLNNDESKGSFDTIPDSDFLSYGDLEDNTVLILIPVDEGKQLIRPEQKVRFGIEALGLGTNKPTTAPDLKKVAVIDDQDNLRILTSDGKSNTQVTDNLHADYISGWSPASDKLLIHVTQKTIKNAYFDTDYQGGEMGSVPTEPVQKFDKLAQPSGFYVVDLSSKRYWLLHEAQDLEFFDWVNKDKLLFNINAEGKTNFVEFDLATYTADTKTFTEKLDKSFIPQMSFNKDGTKWAVTLHESGTETASIIFDEYPELDGPVVAQDRFAAVQGPVVSPDGSKVLYQSNQIVNGPTYIHLYTNGADERLVEGNRVMSWVDNTKFIYALYNNFDTPRKKLYIYDIDAKTSRLLYEGS